MFKYQYRNSWNIHLIKFSSTSRLRVPIVHAVHHMGKWWRKCMLKAAHVNFCASIIMIIISSCFSCSYIKIWCILKVWRAPKRARVALVYASRNFMLLSCSPNFPTCFKSRYYYACILTCNWIYKICYQLKWNIANQQHRHCVIGLKVKSTCNFSLKCSYSKTVISINLKKN